ncbi:Phage anti-repressor protein [Moraxella lacunata]|uniref:Phage anti-repressor protein n=1 Tax=Moraxella lacunata TaxID=477 RepID=A0A378TST6_MORLA|nr:antA/AntB antirepressor family protein [Moraxella lacunata]STZ63925.1 Phage anti-repressor protein [Moraxella lacunata]
MSNITLPTSATALVPTFDGVINGERQLLVNARELHAFLGSRQDFSTWIKSRIFDYDFVENQDYLLHKFMEQLPSGAKHKTDYHLTLDMAKELSMVERNEKGKEARRYFIDCEKRLYALAVSGATDPLTVITAHLQKMSDNMQILANATTATMAKLDHTERYISLLELNQKGHIKVTPEVVEQVKAMKADGYSQANIGRMLRISPATVSQIVNGAYKGNSLTRDDNIARMVETAKSVLEQGEE